MADLLAVDDAPLATSTRTPENRIDDADYLRSNVCGGEGFDWYYASDRDRHAQLRTPITDGQGEPWIWRFKDIRSWWSNPHHDRRRGVRSELPTDWVPGSKPIWFTEYGCAALDKATNQPNKFLDAMSSESTLPYYSNGQRNDALQAAYVRAVTEYWGDNDNNPPHKDGGRMVDMSRAHVWCWDARPYPAFPARDDLWSDGAAWTHGHWLNGRAGAVPLAAIVSDICREAGIAAFDVSGLSGVVRGMALTNGETGRAALQPLMLAYGFDALERDGVLQFKMRTGRVDAVLDQDDLALAEDVSGAEFARAPDSDLFGRVRVSHVEAGSDYPAATAEATLPDDHLGSASETELPMTLTRGEARASAERWLAEAGVARDTVRFALAPSKSELGPGDVVRLMVGGRPEQSWRIDRVERAGAVTVDAVRVDRAVYDDRPVDDAPALTRPYQPPVPVWPVFMDLPLLRGDEVPHAPWLAVSAKPWPGAVAAWSSVNAEGGFDLNTTLPVRSVMGKTLTPLHFARAGAWDRGAPLRLRITEGQLNSATVTSVMAGANLLAIGDGSADRWELIQFKDATLVQPGVWEVELRLRGQAGTDAVMPDVWPAGSTVVLLDGAPKQVALPPDTRGQMRYWRIGPASRPPEDDSYDTIGAAFAGIGLRPLCPCHLRVDGRRITWVRRTRIGGDGWDGPDVPLGEATERYVVRLVRAGAILHQQIVGVPEVQIAAEAWAKAAVGGAFAVEVAQLSDQFGAGAFIRREIDG
ncbi:MAG: hypothetical protein DI498_09560 [Paracoccus denitrificans]|nr:MAG: hypothetical protein DI498_09560 [Paracoccus denitrificans]PZO83956.1 MAG: hypothetical protein DI633_09560 [Paracoccus denitrificans]